MVQPGWIAGRAPTGRNAHDRARLHTPPVMKRRGPGVGRSGEQSRHSGLGEGAELTLARRSVIGAGFALPRDAGRRRRAESRIAKHRDGARRGTYPTRQSGQGTPVFRPAPPRAAGREGVTPTAKKRGDGLERRPPVGTRWPPASARRIGKSRCGSPLGMCPTGRTPQRPAFPGRRSHPDRWSSRRDCVFTATGPPGFHHRLSIRRTKRRAGGEARRAAIRESGRPRQSGCRVRIFRRRPFHGDTPRPDPE